MGGWTDPSDVEEAKRFVTVILQRELRLAYTGRCESAEAGNCRYELELWMAEQEEVE